MASDMEILRRAYDRQNDIRDTRNALYRHWEANQVGATRQDINRLEGCGYIRVALRPDNGPLRYLLTEKGMEMVATGASERELYQAEKHELVAAMDLVVGFDDLKENVARAITRHIPTNYLLLGPPASGKSVLLEAVYTAVPSEYTYMAFGNRTSAAGLSDALFDRQPYILLLDEIDKMDRDTRDVLLGVMESGVILETKSRKTRGIRLECIVMAACNSVKGFSPEFLSRFDLKVHFPRYTRDEFIEVCEGFMARASSCPRAMARRIGEVVFDRRMGDVRQARAIWKFMDEPTEEDLKKAVGLMSKYSEEAARRKNAIVSAQMGLPL